MRANLGAFGDDYDGRRMRALVAELERLFGSIKVPDLGHNVVTTFLDFDAQSSNPAAPDAGVLRFHSATTQGFTRFEQDNEATTNLILGRDNVFIVRNTSGSDIAKGKPVYVTGSTGNVANIALAKADSLTTLPAVGVTLDAISNNAFGQCMKLGVMSSIDTSAFSAGDQIWVSAATAGDLTNTRPVSPNYAQRIGSVLVDGVGNGSYLITTAPFIGGQESGTTVDFACPAITINGGTKITGYRSATATWNPGELAAIGWGVSVSNTSTTVTVTGAALGDIALASFSLDLQGLVLSAYVSATNTVTCVLTNATASTVNLAEGTLRASVLQH